MKHWMTYVKASYEVIMEAEGKSCINLEHEVEAYLVHTFARYMEKPNIPTDAVALKLLSAVGDGGCGDRKAQLQEVAEECLLIDGLQLGSRRWPSRNYYRNMGKIALEHRAWISRPPDLFYEKIALQFETISGVLHHVGHP